MALVHVRHDRVEDLLVVETLSTQPLDRLLGVSLGRFVREVLVEVVEQARESPAVFVLAEVPGQ